MTTQTIAIRHNDWQRAGERSGVTIWRAGNVTLEPIWYGRRERNGRPAEFETLAAAEAGGGPKDQYGYITPWTIELRYCAMVDGREIGQRGRDALSLMRAFLPASDRSAHPFLPGSPANRVWDETEGRYSA